MKELWKKIKAWWVKVCQVFKGLGSLLWLIGFGLGILFILALQFFGKKKSVVQEVREDRERIQEEGQRIEDEYRAKEKYRTITDVLNDLSPDTREALRRHKRNAARGLDTILGRAGRKSS